MEGGEGEKKERGGGPCVVFWLTKRSRVHGERKKKREKKEGFVASYSTNKLLLVARRILTTGLNKIL